MISQNDEIINQKFINLKYNITVRENKQTKLTTQLQKHVFSWRGNNPFLNSTNCTTIQEDMPFLY